MPVTAKKPLYIATGISELNKKTGEIQKIGNGQCKKFLSSAEKVFREAELAFALRDEERAYCLYMRYFNIISAIKKTDEYKKSEAYFKSLIGSANILKALENAEALSEALKARYNELAEEKKNGENGEVPEEEKAQEGKDLEKTDEHGKTKEEPEETPANGKQGAPPGGVLVETVYTMLRDGTALLLMDIRPCEQFEMSHINHKCCINVPADILPPGTTVAAIEDKLPEASRLPWQQRGSTDFICLFDWDSLAADVQPRSVLQNLKDALYKWDRHTILKTEPLVVEGGYDRWLLMYPTLTTNASHPRPPAYSSLPVSPGMTSLENIDYDFGMLETPSKEDANLETEKSLLKMETTSRTRLSDLQMFPRVDRSTKPKQLMTQSRPSSGDKQASTDSEILSVRNRLDSPGPKLEKVNNTEVPSGGQNGTTSGSVSTPSLTSPHQPGALPQTSALVTATIAAHEAEFKDFEVQNKKMIEDHEARLVQVRAEEEKIAHLQNMKAVEARATADLMRKKRGIEEDIRKLQEEEARRRSDLDKMKVAARQHPKPAMDKRPEGGHDTSVTEQKQEVGRSDTVHPDPSQTTDGREQPVVAGKGDVIGGRASHPIPGKAVPVSSLPVPTPGPTPPDNLPKGWDIRFDKGTGRYFYVNHYTKTTSWEPPTAPSIKTDQKSDVTKVKLKDESDASISSTGGIKRSHSSPNIAKMMQDGSQRPDQVLPSVDRASKPNIPANIRTMPAHAEISAAKVRNLQGQWGNVNCGLTGLRNLGNTCYMNSIIQTLSNTTPLTTYFRANNYRDDINKDNILGKGGEIAEEFAVLIKALWSGQYRSIAPHDFKAAISRHHDMFAGYDQQDSQELLVFLMDSLHEDLNRVRKRHHLPEQKNDGVSDKVAANKAWEMHKTVNQSVIVELFQGQFKSTVMCMTCRTKSVTFDTFMYLPLPIPASGRCSIKECLKQFLEEERMTKESRWNCPTCKCKRDAVKNLDIWRLPPILLIHLKRFYMQGMWRDKINTYVDFPLEGLDLSPILLGPQKNRGPYNLYAVSNHYGTMEGGHYTAFCKNANLNKWFKFDDHEVYDIGDSDIKTSAAYILFYSSVKMQSAYR